MGGQVFAFRSREKHSETGSSAGGAVTAATMGARRTTPGTGAKTGIEPLLLRLLASPRRSYFVSGMCPFRLERESGAGTAGDGRARIRSELTCGSTPSSYRAPDRRSHGCVHDAGNKFADLLVAFRFRRVPGTLEGTSQTHRYETKFTQMFINCA